MLSAPPAELRILIWTLLSRETKVGPSYWPTDLIPLKLSSCAAVSPLRLTHQRTAYQ
jgi:hypothetical protein